MEVALAPFVSFHLISSQSCVTGNTTGPPGVGAVQAQGIQEGVATGGDERRAGLATCRPRECSAVTSRSPSGSPAEPQGPWTPAAGCVSWAIREEQAPGQRRAQHGG